VRVEQCLNRALEFGDAAVGAASRLFRRQFSKPAFDELEPLQKQYGAWRLVEIPDVYRRESRQRSPLVRWCMRFDVLEAHGQPCAVLFLHDVGSERRACFAQGRDLDGRDLDHGDIGGEENGSSRWSAFFGCCVRARRGWRRYPRVWTPCPCATRRTRRCDRYPRRRRTPSCRHRARSIPSCTGGASTHGARSGHALQTRALVSAAYLKLIDGSRIK
jgi:hypothetical protein